MSVWCIPLEGMRVLEIICLNRFVAEGEWSIFNLKHVLVVLVQDSSGRPWGPWLEWDLTRFCSPCLLIRSTLGLDIAWLRVRGRIRRWRID